MEATTILTRGGFPQRHRLADTLVLTLLGAATNQDDDLQTTLGQVSVHPRGFTKKQSAPPPASLQA
jgi:hypothetical protein